MTSESRQDRFVSLILAVAILGVAAALVWDRVVAYRLNRVEPDPPVYDPRWSEYARAGLRVGDSTARVTLVEFVDFECPACRMMHPMIDEVRERFKDQLAVVYVQFPLPYHDFAIPAARAVHCAHVQGHLAPYATKLFQAQRLFRLSPWDSLADDVGMPDLARFQACRADSASLASIERGMVAARLGEVTATPTLIVNGWRFSGVLPSSRYLRKFIDRILEGELSPPAAPAGSGVQRKDSAGVAVFTIDRDSPSSGPTQVLTKIWEAPDSLNLFGEVIASAVPVGSDRFAVGLRSPPEVRLLQMNGVQRVLGAQGEGPGEYRSVALAELPGRGFVLHDKVLRRVTTFTADGRTAAIRSLPSITGGVGGPTRSHTLLGVQSTGDVVLSDYDNVPADAPAGLSRVHFSVFSLPPDGKPVELLRTRGMDVQSTEFRAGRATRPIVHPVRFGNRSLIVANGKNIIIGGTQDSVVRVYDLAGNQVLAFVLSGGRTGITSQEIAADEAREAEFYSVPSREGGQFRDEWLASFRQRAHAKLRPLWQAMLPSAAGFWLHTVSDVDGASRLIELDVRGGVRRTVRVPYVVDRIHAIGSDIALVDSRRGDGEMLVSLYRIGPSSR